MQFIIILIDSFIICHGQVYQCILIVTFSICHFIEVKFINGSFLLLGREIMWFKLQKITSLFRLCYKDTYILHLTHVKRPLIYYTLPMLKGHLYMLHIMSFIYSYLFEIQVLDDHVSCIMYQILNILYYISLDKIHKLSNYWFGFSSGKVFGGWVQYLPYLIYGLWYNIKFLHNKKNSR